MTGGSSRPPKQYVVENVRNRWHRTHASVSSTST